MQLYFTDLGALSRQLPLNDLSVNVAPGTLDMAELAGLIDGMPFILMDDGSYDLDLNRFFRACPSMGARSPNTWRSYARDILVWARFLTERRNGKTVWQADRHDVLAFHRARRLSSVPYRISAASWNRSVAALDKLYRWAVEEGIIAASPFGYGVTHRRAAGGHAVLAVTANRARERAVAPPNRQRVDKSEAVPTNQVLKRHVLKKCRFARAGLADDVDVQKTVFALDAEDTLVAMKIDAGE